MLSNGNTSVDILKTRYNLALASSHVNSPKYLWCVNHYGPNNQLKDFTKCCVIAIMHNFTLIIPPIFPHYQDKTQGIQTFDDFYDLEQLAQVLNFVTIKQFIQKTKDNQNTTTINCNMQQRELDRDMTYYSENSWKSVEKDHNIKIHFHRLVNLSSQPNLKKEEIIHKAENCTSIFLNIHYLALTHLSKAENTLVQKLFRHIHRTSLIQRMASQLINQLPQLAIGNFSGNKLTKWAVAHMRLGDRVVMSVPRYLKQILHLIANGVHFTHLHIMCPYLNSTDIDQVTNSVPVAITTTTQLFDRVRLVLDDYLFDVLEQEISFQAPIFIASPWTTYSATIVMQRLHQKKGTTYVFSDGPENHTFLVTEQNATYYC
ncbi:unnamed protein product [Rotaria socialis]